MEKLNAQIGDTRLNERAELIYNSMSIKKTTTIRKLGCNRASEVAGSRFFNNKKVTPERLLKGKQTKLNSICKGKHVLAIQDTSEISFTSHRNKTSGLGDLRHNNVGLMLHPTLAVDAEDGYLLGAINVKTWSRPELRAGGRSRYKPLTTPEKESIRWIEEAEVSKKILSKADTVTIVADRESDCYRLLDKTPDMKTHVLVRAAQNRKLINDECDDELPCLFQYLDGLPVSGTYDLEIRASSNKRKMRTTKVEIRFSRVKIAKSSHCHDSDASSDIALYSIDVKERPEMVPKGEKSIHWRLLTSHEVETIDHACACVFWYKQRWTIEQIFRLCKRDGLKIEDSLLGTADGLIRLLTMSVLVAVQIYQLMQVRDAETKREIKEVFELKQIKALKALNSSLEGKTQKQKNPYPSKSLSWAAWIIARLGGWKGYASERKPGPITFFNGLQAFENIYLGWNAANKDVCIP